MLTNRFSPAFQQCQSFYFSSISGDNDSRNIDKKILTFSNLELIISRMNSIVAVIDFCKSRKMMD